MNNLIQGGINISWEEVESVCVNCLPSRPRIAEVLIKHGYVHTISEGFAKYLDSGTK